jgi:hypothetical protein
MRKTNISSFEILGDIIEVVSRNKVKNINIIGQNTAVNRSKPSKLQQLYEGIHDGIFTSDIDAINALGYDNVKNSAYVKLKYDLKKRLLNTLFFIDTEQPLFTDLEKARFNARRESVAIDFLWLRGARNSAVQLFEELLIFVLQYEMTNFALDIAKKLTTYYSLHGDKKKYAYYKGITIEQQRIYEAETKAELFVSEFTILNARKSGIKPQMYDMAKDFLAQLEPYNDIESVTFISFKGVIARNQCEGNKDFEKLIEVCEHYNQLILSKPFLSKTPVVINLFNIMVANMILERNEATQEAIRQYMSYLNEKDLLWFKAISLQTLLSLHTEQYDNANLMLVKVRSNKSFKNVMPFEQERWLLYDAYLQLLVHLGLLKNNSIPKKLNYNKLYNNMQFSHQDKQGLNIPLRIFEIIVAIYHKEHLHPKKEVLLSQKIENLVKYRERNFNIDSPSFRFDTFLSLIELLLIFHYQIDEIEANSIDLVANFGKKGIDFRQEGYYMEVLSYSNLWVVLRKTLRFHIPKPVEGGIMLRA